VAQFDVHLNTGPSKDDIPFVVTIQSSIFDGYGRRLVAPLVLKDRLPEAAFDLDRRTFPEFQIEKTKLVLNPLEIVSVATERLGVKVASLAESGQTITDAIDEVLTRSWG
jgi:toxin CcdB